jgi:hypothetical protein
MYPGFLPDLPEEGAPDRCFVTGFKEKGPAALIEYVRELF